MNKEQAKGYIGKVVYTVDYEDISIQPRTISNVSESRIHDSTFYQLETLEGETLFTFKKDYESAVRSLIRYYEVKVTVEMNNLKEAEALQLVGL